MAHSLSPDPPNVNASFRERPASGLVRRITNCLGGGPPGAGTVPEIEPVGWILIVTVAPSFMAP